MTEKFEKPRDNVPGNKPEAESVSFDEGVAQALKKIVELVITNNRNIVVTINGSNIEVGKTTLLAVLQKKLRNLGIPCGRASNYNVEHRMVIFREELGLIWKDRGDTPLPADRYGDLCIGIYRPDRPFSIPSGYKPAADILIRNEEAGTRSANEPERAKMGEFSPKIQELLTRKNLFLLEMAGDKGPQIAFDLTERAKYLQDKYPDHDHWEVWHVIAGSTLPLKDDPNYYTQEDFPGEDSVERFIDHLIAKYTI